MLRGNQFANDKLDVLFLLVAYSTFSTYYCSYFPFHNKTINVKKLILVNDNLL